MKLFSFKSSQGNFGDDLNEWLWPKLFGSDIEKSPNTTLVGIGSILDKRLNAITGNRIIFGSGIRSTSDLPQTSETLKIRFVRGPISALALGNETKYITDPAILVASVCTKPTTTTKAVGLMPHYHSLPLLDWAKIARKLGFLYIDPRNNVDQTLALLKSCNRIVTEAMHGAIVADALRIPWRRISIAAWRKEGIDVSSLKWLDWGLSSRVDISSVNLNSVNLSSSHLMKMASLPTVILFRRRLVNQLEDLAKQSCFQLSTDQQHCELLDKCLHELAEMRNWLKSQST